MVIPIVICAVCFAAGASAAALWLPDLAQGSVGGVAFVVVCGLIGAALSAAGLDIYEIVREMGRDGLARDSEFSPSV
jgi:hypothetical protein